MITLVIPAYNEAGRLPGSLGRIRTYLDACGEEYEVVVVDDGSGDDTAGLAERMLAGWPQLQVIRLSRNQGKGAAIRTGMLAGRGEHRAFTDADLSTPMEELPKLRARITGRCHVAIASRALPETNIEVHQVKRRELMGRTYNVLLRMLVLPGIRDSQCGFKVFSAEAAEVCFRPQRTARFGFDAEALVRARKAGYDIAELPVTWRHVEASRVNSIRDSSRMLFDLIMLRIRGT